MYDFLRRTMIPVELDTTDLTILAALQKDARTTQRAIAAAAGIAPSTCAARIARLEDAAIITGYTAVLDHRALGRPVEAFLAVRVRPHRRTLVEPFVQHVIGLGPTRALHHVAGVEDFLVHVCVEDITALQRLVLDDLTARDEVVSVHTTLIYQSWRGSPVMPVA